MSAIISVESVSKRYSLGSIGGRTLREDVSRWWARLRNQQDPYRKVEYPAPANSGSQDLWALKEVSLEVEAGEAIGIIGRNGAGKSTLLKILSRITAPTRGQVRMSGRIASLLEVGTGFHPELTGRVNIFLSGAILGMTKEEVRKKFDEITDFSGVEQFIDTPVKRYSSGMYVRLAFAVAAHLESEILIIDEVLAVGDVEFQQKCLGKMTPAESGGRTVLFVSHNMASIQRLCNRAIFLDLGSPVQIGDTASVINRYLETITKPATFWQRDTPSGSDIFFDQVYLSNGDRESIQQVTTATKVHVVMDFTILKPTTDLLLGMTVYDSHRNSLFSSAPQDIGLSVAQQTGSYRYVASLPEHIFMPQKYTIKPVLWSQKVGVFDSVESITFPVVETASLLNNTPGGRAGSLLVLCDWKRDR